jgi:galactokinase
MAFELEAAGIKLSGADCLIKSDVPIGAGLSSSAALEISIGKALLAISDQEMGPTDFALLAQAAEHKYVGTHCGIMDQLTVVLGKQSHALLIDCRSLQIDEVGLNLPNVILVICNTNLKHNLATSAYNQRREECEQAVEILRRRMPAIRALRDVTPSDIEKHAADLGELLEHRARHVVTENERTLQAAKALGRGDTEELGRLMLLSHRSLRDDYQVSSQELDFMVDLAGESTAVLGSRLTGGGFGGCTVNLVVSDQAERFAQFIRKEYARATGIEPGICFVEADDGVREER